MRGRPLSRRARRRPDPRRRRRCWPAPLSRIASPPGTPSPVVAVGRAFIDRTPLWLKDFAVRRSAPTTSRPCSPGWRSSSWWSARRVGVLAARRRTAGLLVAFAVVGALGAAAVLSRPGARRADVLPTLVGTLVGPLGADHAARPLGRTPPAAESRRAASTGAGLLLTRGRGSPAVAATAGRDRRRGSAGRAAASGERRPRCGRHRPRRCRRPVAVPPAACLDVPGHHARTSCPTDDFYRIDTALVGAAAGHRGLEAAGPRHGRAARSRSTCDDLLAQPMIERWSR